MPIRRIITITVILGIAFIVTLTFISSGAIMENNQESENMNQENTQTTEQHTEVQTSSNSSEKAVVSQKSSSTHHTSVSSDSSNQEQTTEHVVESEMTISDGEDTTQIQIIGNIEPDETITVTATQNGSPLIDAPVFVNGEPVDITNEEGEAQITVPSDEKFVLEFRGEHSSTEFQIR